MSRTNGGIPANIIWDEDNPPMKNTCCGLVEIHDPKCDGSCPQEACTELQVELLNENREWARLNLSVNGINIPTFRLQNQVTAIIAVLSHLGSKDMLDIEFQKATLESMRKIRIPNETSIKRANLGLPPKGGLLGPDGRAL